jgi:hypothetical protein
MDHHDSNKRLKSSSGAPIKKSQHHSAAANLPAYQPPAAVGARGGSRYVISFVPSLLQSVDASLIGQVVLQSHVRGLQGNGSIPGRFRQLGNAGAQASWGLEGGSPFAKLVSGMPNCAA